MRTKLKFGGCLQHIPYYVQYAIAIFFIWEISRRVVWDFGWPYPYDDFPISDWLINYQGGFVRRGFVGELLWRIYQWHPYPLMIVVKTIALCSFLCFAVLSLIVFHKNRWSVLPLLFPLVLVGACVVWCRRDYLMMLFAYLIFDLFFRYLSNRKKLWLILSLLVNCLAIVIYEPTFFFTTPILFCLLLKKNGGMNMRTIIQSGLICLPPVVTMGIVCLSKGTAEQAAAIWESWMPMFQAYPDSTGTLPPIGACVGFLGKGSSTFNSHLNLLFRCYEGWQNVISNVLYVVAFPMIYFIVTRVPLLNHRKQIVEQNSDKALLGSILIIQFVAMLPMFTILSCDLGRTIPYCIYTTFFLVHLSHKYKIDNPIPDFVDKLSTTVQSKLDSYTICNSFWFYLLVLFVAPLRGYYGPKIRDNLFFRVIYILKNLRL